MTIVAVQTETGEMQTAPMPDYVFRSGDLLFSLGKNEDNDRVIAME